MSARSGRTRSLDSFTTNLRGQFFIRGLPNGEYVAYTSNTLGYFDEIHNNIRCTVGCSSSTAISSGTRITVTGRRRSPGRDLADLVTRHQLRPRRPDAGAERAEQPAHRDDRRHRRRSRGRAIPLNAGAPTSYLLEAGFAARAPRPSPCPSQAPARPSRCRGAAGHLLRPHQGGERARHQRRLERGEAGCRRGRHGLA